MTWGESIFLGVLLGLGYLTKGIMFPMAFVFTGVALMLAGRSAKKLYKILVAFSVFLLLSATVYRCSIPCEWALDVQ